MTLPHQTSAHEARTSAAVAGRLRRLALAVLGVVAVGLAAYALAWYLLATRFEAEALAWIERQRAGGLDIDYTTVTTDGFPGDVRVQFQSPVIAGRVDGQTWSWRGERAVVATGLLAPRRVSIDVAGEQAIEGGAPDRWRQFQGHARAFGATVRVGGSPQVNLRVEALGLGAASGEAFSVDAVAVEYRPLTVEGGGDAVQVRAAVDRLVLPPDLALPLGSEIRRLALESRIAGRLQGSTVATALAAWRRAGGQVDILRLNAEYGPLSLHANGRLGLDADDQPEGVLSASLVGLSETVDALVAKGIVPRRNAGMLRAVVSAMGRRHGPGAASEVRLPLTIKDRVLSLGPVAVFEVPVIRWPAGDG
jgi:hypothetical protein